MACNCKNIAVIMIVFTLIQSAITGDPNIVSDFTVPTTNGTLIDANFFTFTGMRVQPGNDTPTAFKVLKASLAELPSLNGQSVSYATLHFPAGTVNPLHTHPRSAELLYLLAGSLEVGFIDTTNKLYNQTLQQGDMFVFPKGLVHYQYNADANLPAMAVSAFGSANAGTVSIPSTVFSTGIDESVLAMSFKTDVATIEALKAGLATKA